MPYWGLLLLWSPVAKNARLFGGEICEASGIYPLKHRRSDEDVSDNRIHLHLYLLMLLFCVFDFSRSRF
jgi:hypothetical protein